MASLAGQLALASLIARFKANTRRAVKENSTLGFFRSRIALLEGYWKKFQEAHLLLMETEALRNEAYFTEDHHGITELRYSTALGYLYDKESSLAALTGRTITETPRATHQVHLPKITLPDFSGRNDEWEPFRDMFRSLIHGDRSLTSVQKLHYLKSSVKGEAKDALDGIPTTEANYDLAWSFLLKRYDNERLMVQRHLRQLSSLMPLKEEDANGLQTLVDQVVKRREALRTLQQPIEQWDEWFIFFTAKGMDSVTRRDWEKVLAEEAGSAKFERVAEFLQGRIQALKAVASIGETQGKQDKGTKRYSHAERTNKARVLTTSTSGGECANCKDHHYIGHCPKLAEMDGSERRNTISRLRLCINCLRSGHRVNECPSTNSCRECKTRHHTLLHRESGGKRGHPSDAQEERSAKRAKGNQKPTTSVNHAATDQSQ